MRDPARTRLLGRTYSLRHSGARRCANARIPSRMSCEANEARRSSISSLFDVAAAAVPRAPAARRSRACCRAAASGELPASSPASCDVSASSSAAGATRLTSPQLQRRRGVDVFAEQEQLARARRADRVDEPSQPGVRVHQPELRRRHTELDALLRDPDVAGERQLQSPTDRVSRQRRQRRPGERLECLDRFRERVRDQALGRSSNSPSSSGISPMSYPAENIPPAPVSTRQRTAPSGLACSASVAVIASRIGWSSALRFSTLEIVRRTTPAAGSSTSSLPSASSCVRPSLGDTGRKASCWDLEHPSRPGGVERKQRRP